MYTRNDIVELLNNMEIPYELVDHPKAYTMEDLKQLDLPHQDREAKNVFVRDRKKKNYFLVTVRGHKRVNLDLVREKFETSRLSFVSESELSEILGVEKGSLSPLTILNDEENKVQFVLDDEFLSGNELIAAHPNENTCTIYLNVNDLIDLFNKHKHVTNLFSTN